MSNHIPSDNTAAPTNQNIESDTPTPKNPQRLKVAWLGCILFLSTLGLYHLNGKALPGGDTVPHRYLPLSILCSGDLNLNEFPLGRILPNGTMQQPYFLVPGRNQNQHSSFGVGPGIMATPVYAVAALFNQTFTYGRILKLGKWAASIMVALAVLLLFFACLPDVSVGGALAIAIVWGWGTSSWSMISQAIWQHTGAAPWLIGGLLCLSLGRKKEQWIPWAGLCLGFATVCRTTNAFIAIAFTLYVFLHHRRVLWRFLALASIPAILLFAYNTHAFGSPFKFGQLMVGPEIAKWKTGVSSNIVTNPWLALQGLAGTLISPSRGIFNYSPVLLFGLAGLLLSWRKGGDPLYRWSSIAFASVILLHGVWYDWWGGWTYGYRRPFDTVFLLAFGIAPLWAGIQSIRWKQWSFGVMFFFSIWVQGVGAFSYDFVSWNNRPNVDRNPHRLWSVTNSQLVHYLANPRWVETIPLQDAPRLTLKICPIRVTGRSP